MKIILGVFGESYDELEESQDAIGFFSGTWLKYDNKHPNNPLRSPLADEVCYNLDHCKECVFDVTHLRLPFNDMVATLKELYVVIHNEEYFEKTTFFVKGEVINKYKLKELFILNEPIEFKDYAELFILPQ